MSNKNCCKKFDNEVSVKGLNTLLANLLVVKHGMYGVHWHVKGLGFLEIHNFSEEVYDFLVERYDVLAERIIQLNSTIPVTAEKQFDPKTITPIEHGWINTKDGWQLIKYYLRRISRETACIKAKVDEIGDLTTSALLDEDIVQLDKFLWLAKSSCPCTELPETLTPKIKDVCKLEKK